MPDRDERFVCLVPTQSAANVVVTTLSMNGIAARTVDRLTGGGVPGLTLLGSDNIGGIEVWADDPAQVEEAREMIAQMQQEVIDRAESYKAKGPVDIACDRCDKKLHFEAEARGTVQECPACGNFIDLYEGDDSMDWDTAEVDENDPELEQQ